MMAFLLALALLIGFSGAAEAGPVAPLFAAVGSWITGTLAAGGIGAFLLRTVASLALSALSQALRKKPKVRSAGITTEATTAGGTVPQRLIFGRYATGGQHVCPPMTYETDDDPNEFLVYVIAIADKPVTGLVRIIIDGTPVEFARSPAASLHGDTAGATVIDPPDIEYSDKFWIRFHNGSQTAADAYLRRVAGTYPVRPWTADMIGAGTAYAVLTFRGKSEERTYKGFPSVKFVVDGHALRDPRTGADVFTRNPAVIAYNILRGIDVPGGEKWGVGTDKFLPHVIAAANLCDEAVPVSSGGTRTRYQAGLEISVEDEPHSALAEIVKAMGGDVADMGGTWMLKAGENGGAVYSFTDDDVIVTDSRSLRPYPGLNETVNGIHGSYPEPSQQWKEKEAVPLYNAAYEAADGGRRLIADVAFPAVTNGRQVRALMREMLDDHRKHRTHVITLPPDALGINLGEMVAWTSDVNGYSGKLFKVAAKRVDPQSLCVAFTVTEHDPADYDYDPDSEGVLPVVPSPIPHDPILTGVPGFNAVAAVIPGDSGSRPGIVITWDGRVDARSVFWEIHRVAGSVPVASGAERPAAGRKEVTEGIVRATSYAVRGQLVIRNRTTAPGPWVYVTTDDVRLIGDDLAPGVFDNIHLSDSLLDFIEAQGGSAADDAAAAAAARDAAIAAADNAAAAAALADQAFDDAAVARDAAQQASTAAANDALAAVNAAGAAAGHAADASSYADDAGVQAVAAHGTATAAQTSAGQALAYRNEAASSALTAEGASVSASQSAGVSVNAAMRVLPADLGEGARYWTINATGSPSTIASPTTGTNITVNADDTITFPGTATATQTFVTKGVLPYQPDRTYRITAEVRARGAVPPPNRLRAAFRRLEADTYLNINAVAGGDLTPDAVDVWQVRSATVTTNVSSRAAWLRLGVQNATGTTPAADIDIRSIVAEDITDTLAAAASAAAAAVHEQVASTKATEAGQHASAAQASETAASTSATNAAGSASTAASAAQTAVDQAGIATNSAAAAQSAAVTAASGSPVAMPSVLRTEFWNGLTATGLSLDANNVLTVAASAGSPNILPVGSFAFVEGNTYKITVRIRSIGGVNSNTRFRAYRQTLSETGTQIEATNFGNLSPLVADQWENISRTWKAYAIAGGARQKIGINLQGSATPAFPTEIAWALVEDVTASTEAGASATAAAGSASTASTSASNAAQSASAAQGSQTSAATSASQASNSSISAANAATSAEGSSASAFESSQLAARALGGGVSPNPIFNDWPVAANPPTGYFFWNTDTNNTADRVVSASNSNVKYKNAVRLISTAVALGPAVALVSSGFTYASDNPAAVYVTAEITRTSGSASGGYVRVAWVGNNTRTVTYSLMGKTNLARAATISFAAERPDGFDPGPTPQLRVVVRATSDEISGQSPAATTLLVHRLDYQEVTADASVMEWQRAKVAVEGITSAAYGFRVRVGGATGEVELVALDNPALGPPASAFRVSADIILLDSILGTHIRNAEIGTLKLAGRSVSTQWSANSNSVTINPQHDMDLIVMAAVRVSGSSNGSNIEYILTRNGAQIDSNIFSGSPYSANFSQFITVPVAAGTHVIAHSYSGTQAWFDKYRLAIIGLYR